MKSFRRKNVLCVAIAVGILSMLVSCSKEPGKEQTAPKRLKVAAVFATPLEEPWDKAIHQALERASKELNVEYVHTDDVPPTRFEKVLRDYATQGADIIVGDAFAAEEIARRVARDFPDIAFCFGSGLGPAKPNFSVFDDWIHEPAYLAGMMAGRISKSGEIGVVAGFPVPEVNRIVNAFAEGARSANPSIKCHIVFIGSWFDPPKAGEATHALLQKKVDVIYAERAGVIEVCADKKIPVFGNLVDQKRISPDWVVTSVVWDMWPTVNCLISRVRNKSFTAEDYAEWSMMAKGGARLEPLAAWDAKLDEATKQLIEKTKDEILTGRLRVPVIESKPVSD